MVYRWFVSLYGHDLADYLSGWDCAEESFIGNNLFIPIGAITLTLALVFVLGYYYIINSARFNKWWHWSIVLLLIGIINMLIGHYWTASELPNIGDCLMYIDGDKETNPTALINESDFWLFGFANFLVSSLFFIAFSFLFKWWSKQCHKTPF